MSIFNEELAALEGFIGSDGVSTDAIRKAEMSLSLRFSSDYFDYLRAFGIAAVNGHELTGLGSAKRLDVVERTLAERARHEGCGDLYVIEDLCIDNLIAWQSPSGKVYETFPGEEPVFLANSLLEFLRE